MKKKIFWLVGTLILGALGSGLWELVVRPIFGFLVTAALNIVTLGLDSLRNGLYEEAAHGQYERVGIAVLSIIAGVLSGVVFGIFIKRSRESRSQKSSANKMFVEVLPVVFVTTFALLLFQRIAYINRAVNHFDQLATIVAPFQTEEQRLQVRSEFSQMNTREEYVQIIQSLSSMAEKNGAKVPDFTIY